MDERRYLELTARSLRMAAVSVDDFEMGCCLYTAVDVGAPGWGPEIEDGALNGFLDWVGAPPGRGSNPVERRASRAANWFDRDMNTSDYEAWNRRRQLEVATLVDAYLVERQPLRRALRGEEAGAGGATVAAQNAPQTAPQRQEETDDEEGSLAAHAGTGITPHDRARGGPDR